MKGIFMKKLSFLFVLLLSIVLMSCKAELKLSLNQDGSMDIEYNGGSGDAFTKLMLAATGEDSIFNADELRDQLAWNGFSNVDVKIKGTSEIHLKMKDKNCSSFFFTSGLVAQNNGSLTINFTNEAVKKFYDTADEQTKMILDLLIAPVFNNQSMGEEQYLMMLGSLYGKDAAAEIKESVLNVEIKSYNGNKVSFSYKLPEVLCGNL